MTLRTSGTTQTVVGDPDRLRELLSNLLFNGVAYNRPNGLVSVDVDHEGATVVLRVRDTGIGIDADDLPRVFDRFYRGELAREREPAGAGLGLALVHWIVAAHSGTVECTSEPGSWTEFVVRFPSGHQLPRASSPLVAAIDVPRSTGHEGPSPSSRRQMLPAS